MRPGGDARLTFKQPREQPSTGDSDASSSLGDMGVSLGL